MPKLRLDAERRVDAAIEELAALASASRGIDVVRAGADQVTVTVGRAQWSARVLVRDAVSERDARALVEAPMRGSMIIVANQLSADAKEVLSRRNDALRTSSWSWLDRRGELELNHPSAAGVIRFASEADRGRVGEPWRVAAPSSDGPIRGRAGISFAAALLLQPDDPPSIRRVAREAQMSHGAVGEAAQQLRAAGLIRPTGEPEIEDLFWALAAVWGPARAVPVRKRPTPEIAARLHANVQREEPLVIPGWCQGGDEAAADWGAPLLSVGAPPLVWLVEEGDARRLERAVGPATWDDAAAVVAVPPTALVGLYRRWPPHDGRTLSFLPTAHPLFLALDLARDPSRGREILEQWQPGVPGVHRVW